MPAPRSIDLTLDGTDQLGVVPLWAWQANALTLICDVSDITLLDGVATITAKIHSTATPQGTTPLASQDVASDATEVTFDFTTLEMSFDIGTGKSLHCYLFITALDAAGDELQTLYARRIEIKASGWSASVADGVLTYADGVAQFTIDGTVLSFPVSATASATRGTGRITYADGLAACTINYVTISWPVMAS